MGVSQQLQMKVLHRVLRVDNIRNRTNNGKVIGNLVCPNYSTQIFGVIEFFSFKKLDKKEKIPKTRMYMTLGFKLEI